MLLPLSLLAMGLFAVGCGGGSDGDTTATSEPIKVGVLHDATGAFAPVGQQQIAAAKMALEEINADGGLLGRKVEMVLADSQSDIKRYQELSRKLILEDKVDVLVAGYTSASREAVRPVVDQFKMLYIYNTQYEGGVADHYVFATGATPEAQWKTQVPYMIKKFGPKIYTIAADYNFGTISADWVEKIAKENGGEVIGTEFSPLDNSNYSASIQRIQKANPDWVAVMMVGQKQASFFPQWGASGMAGKIPLGSSIAMAQGYEHLQFKPPALAEMYATATFMEELAGDPVQDPTGAAKAFVDKWYKVNPNSEYIGMEGEAEYTGVKLWAEAVKLAGTTETEAVIKAFETGNVSFNAPSGLVTVDPATHHFIRDIWLARSDMNHKITFVEKWPQVKPDWLSATMNVNLPEMPQLHQQFTPDSAPL